MAVLTADLDYRQITEFAQSAEAMPRRRLTNTVNGAFSLPDIQDEELEHKQSDELLGYVGDKQKNINYLTKAGYEGLIKTNNVSDRVRTETQDRKTKQKKRDREFYDTVLMLNERLEWIDERLGEIDESLVALSEVKNLYLNGTLDPKNPEHAALLETANITIEELDQNGATALDEKQKAFEQEQIELEADKAKIHKLLNHKTLESENTAQSRQNVERKGGVEGDTPIKTGFDLKSAFEQAAPGQQALEKDVVSVLEQKQENVIDNSEMDNIMSKFGP
jgi:hypothetical protein